MKSFLVIISAFVLLNVHFVRAEILPNNPWMVPERTSNVINIEPQLQKEELTDYNFVNAEKIQHLLEQTDINTEFNSIEDSQLLHKIKNYTDEVSANMAKKQVKKHINSNFSSDKDMHTYKIELKDIPAYKDAEKNYRIYKSKAKNQYNRLKSEAKNLKRNVETSIKNSTGINVEQTINDTIKMMK